MPACPGCQRQYGTTNILKTKCDTCSCAFCPHGACTGTIGGTTMVLMGNGRPAGSTCKKCGKGKMKNI